MTIEALPPGEVHVLYTLLEDIADPALLADYLALLSPAERTRQEAFAVEKPRLEHLATRALARTALSRFAPVAPAEWEFRASRYGKPEIVSPAGSGLSFNLSNTTGLVACAVTAGGELGVDVEYLERSSQLRAIANRFFAPPEADEVCAATEAELRPRFFDYWTLKESYIKARGMGLALPLRRFWFLLDREAPPRIAFAADFDDTPEGWWFARFAPAPRHAGAVAFRPARSTVAPVRLVLRRVVPLRDDRGPSVPSVG